MAKLRILLAGETWVTYGIHIKGFNAYYTGDYEEALEPLRVALNSSGHEVMHISNHEAPSKFPQTLSELSNFDVILFSDLSADTLLLHPDTVIRSQKTPNRLNLIADYIGLGGGFAMIGGWMSFAGYGGQAKYHSTPIEEILPIYISPFDDRVEEPEGVVPKVETEHEILESLPTLWPFFLGYNRLRAKEGAVVVMTCRDDPFLAVIERGKGRTAAFASDCSPHWGTHDFINWPYYATFWDQLVTWLAGLN